MFGNVRWGFFKSGRRLGQGHVHVGALRTCSCAGVFVVHDLGECPGPTAIRMQVHKASTKPVTVKIKIHLLAIDDRKSDTGRAAAPQRMARFRVFGIRSGSSSTASLGTGVAQPHCWSMLRLHFMQFAWLQYWRHGTCHWRQDNRRISAMRGPGQAARLPEGRQAPPQEHQEQTEQLGQEQNGRHPNLDISAQRFCVGIGQPGLHFANGLPDGPVAGHASRGPVTRLWWTRTPVPPVTSATASVTTGVRCGRPIGRSRPCSRREPGQRWELLHPDSSCRDVQTCPCQPRVKYRKPPRF